MVNFFALFLVYVRTSLLSAGAVSLRGIAIVFLSWGDGIAVRSSVRALVTASWAAHGRYWVFSWSSLRVSRAMLGLDFGSVLRVKANTDKSRAKV